MVNQLIANHVEDIRNFAAVKDPSFEPVTRQTDIRAHKSDLAQLADSKERRNTSPVSSDPLMVPVSEDKDMQLRGGAIHMIVNLCLYLCVTLCASICVSVSLYLPVCVPHQSA